jgi:chemotaxis protein CheC
MKNTGLNEEELGFLKEIINIGSGNAAVALEQLLGTAVEMKNPDVRVVNQSQLSSVLDSMTKPVVGVKMNVVGDFKGQLFFILSKLDKKVLTECAYKARPGAGKIKIERDDSAIAELGNIIAGVCLYSIHDFCGLNIYHTVPELSTDMLLSLMDESIADKMKIDPNFIWIESVFKVDDKTKNNIPVYFVMILAIDSLSKLKTAIEKAREKMFSK